MAVAANANTGYSGHNSNRAQAVASGTYRPVVAQTYMRHNKPTETDAERQIRHAEATGTSRALWR